MKASAGYLNARQAAIHVGYQPLPERNKDGSRNHARTDPAMRAFYEAARRKGVAKYGSSHRVLFKQEDLDRAWGSRVDTDQPSPLDRMAERARRHVAGESMHG